MFGIITFILHACAVWVGCQIAQLEYVDIWRAAFVALISYVVMFIVGLVLLPLVLIPWLGQLFSVAVLTLGTAFAAKMVLAVDWKPAWTIGITAGVLNALGTFILSGCTRIG